MLCGFLDIRTVLYSSTVSFRHVILKHPHRQPSYINVAHTFLAVVTIWREAFMRYSFLDIFQLSILTESGLKRIKDRYVVKDMGLRSNASFEVSLQMVGSS
jgi:hypothetical protein